MGWSENDAQGRGEQSLGERLKVLDDVELNHQHERIADGTYGVCEICGIELSAPLPPGKALPALCPICSGRASKS